MPASIVQPRQIILGGGAIDQVPAILKDRGLNRPLIVTDSYMVQSGNVERLSTPLKEAGMDCHVFADVVSDPTSSSISNGLNALKAHGSDCVVALGGGSPIDSAKAVAFLAKWGGTMRDYKVPVVSNEPGLPVIAIPTTAGTGSEVTRFTIITDDDNDEKMLCTGMGFCPDLAVVDYELTLSKPARLTADTGLDALTHAIEAYVSRKQNPYADGMAQLAMRSLGRHLRIVYNEPDNRAAREEVMLAATWAGLAFSNSSVCLVHGMSRPIGAFFHIPHGLSNAMLLPRITEFSIVAAKSRYADCARFMGVAAATDSDKRANEKLIDELHKLNVDLNVPSLRQAGVDEGKYFSLLPLMAEQAHASGSPGNNPRVPSIDETISLYSEVW